MTDVPTLRRHGGSVKLQAACGALPNLQNLSNHAAKGNVMQRLYPTDRESEPFSKSCKQVVKRRRNAELSSCDCRSQHSTCPESEPERSSCRLLFAR
ncbi:unnamed protein product, partial [Symbiodinium microadriaticum]